VVLGAADAIGAGIARRFAREEAQVLLLDSSHAGLEATQSIVSRDGGRASLALIEGAAPESVSAAIAAAARTYGAVQILVNNPLAAPFIAPLEGQQQQHFGAAFDRIQAAAAAMRAVMPCMRDARWGRIVNIGHRYGEGVNESIAAYNAAAWSLVGLTRSAAVDWGQYQIATNLLLPAADTPEFRDCRERRTKVLDLMVGQLPLRRMGDVVEDIGGAAVFLASDESTFVNGQVVYGDGGQHIAGPVLNIGRFG
jgi:NAD(P)-dependent dehydrogenase (short-subunit alcohol dehydrogenase family)